MALTTYVEAIKQGIREEMARTLTDVVFRRTSWGITFSPESACLRTCAEIMSNELGWDDSRTRRELSEVKAVFPMRT